MVLLYQFLVVLKHQTFQANSSSISMSPCLRMLQGRSAFVTALGIRGACNNFDKSAYDDVFDFNNNTLKSNKASIKWHPSCYSTFTNSKSLSFFKDNQSNEERTSPLNDTDRTCTCSQKPLINFKCACIFCGYVKHNNDKKLILLQYESVIQKIKNKCESKGDLEFKRKIGISFENLPVLDAKYHHVCYNKYLSEKYTGPRSVLVHNIAFQQLTNNLNPLLEEGRALEMLQLLKTYKCYLQENNYEHFDSYTTQKLKKDCCSSMDFLL